MKAFARSISMTGVLLLAFACAAGTCPGRAFAEDGPCVAAASAATSVAAGELSDTRAYPTFCQIPPMPTGVRDASAFKNAVVATRLSGARLDRNAAPATWSVQDTGGFARAAIDRAAPPPAISSGEDTAAFIAAARARATPPPRPR